MNKLKMIKRNKEFQKRKVDDYDDNRDELARFEIEIDNDTTFSKNDLSFINKPQNSKFQQQYLTAWTPLLTPKFVFFLFIVCSFVFIPIGIVLFISSNEIYEYHNDYTDCIDIKTFNLTCHDQIVRNSSYSCKCRIEIDEKKFKKEPLMVYYMLDTYYQNHRRYVKSRDYDQLLGLTGRPLTPDCEPYRYAQSGEHLVSYAPCGAVANSFFNDKFEMYFLPKERNKVKINISKEDLAWDSDKQYKFKNPNQKELKNTIRPPNWKFNITSLEDGYNNNDLIVWMRTAAFSAFRKLYGRIMLSKNFELWRHETNRSITNKNIESLPEGEYYVEIDYQYMVKQFYGRKVFILANTSWFGGRCYFLAISYLVIGVICFITAFVLLYLHYFYGNMSYEEALHLLKQYDTYDE